MFRKTLSNWLSAAFQLPVVEDITQTSVEQAVSFDLTNYPVDIRITEGKGITFDFSCDIQYRSPNDSLGIGLLSLKLADKSNRPPGFNIKSVEATELVQYVTPTEMIISKTVVCHVEMDYNKVRELIKCVDMTDSLSCNDNCVISPQ